MSIKLLAVLLQTVTLCEGSLQRKVFNNTQNFRIHNAEDADAGEFPFVGVLLVQSGFGSEDHMLGQCGGSILSKRVILTAAHCVVSETEMKDYSTVSAINQPINMQFHVGETSLEKYETSEQVLDTAGVIVHPEYSPTQFGNDIALLITKQDIVFNDKVKAISLPSEADKAQLYAEGAPITVIGWGTTETGTTTTELRKLPYEVVSDATCKENYGSAILPGMLCTGKAPMTVKHAAGGDSGGPLFKKTGVDEFVQLALVSWGPGAGEQTEKSWDINTDVLYYKTWITTNMAAIDSDYDTMVYAEDSTKFLSFENIRNYLYKTVSILPTTSTKYTTITFKSGKMGANDMVLVYDGNNVAADKQLAQLTGTITEQTFTATTNKGLTVAIMTDLSGISEGFSFDFKQTSTKGGSNDLVCPSGYKACSDKYYCLNFDLFCDSEDGYGQCRDGSDEVKANCKSDDNNNNNTNNDKDTDEDKDKDNGSGAESVITSGILGLLVTSILILG